MASEPNERIFKINTRVRDIIRKRLPELEEFCVSVAMEAYREIVKNEPDDPFQCLRTNESSSNTREHSNTFENLGELFCEPEGDEEEVAVTTREFNGKSYYTFLDDEDNDLRGVHERIIGDDNESEVGDLVGYVDKEDRFWEAIAENGQIVKYQYKQYIVPAKKDDIMRYPDIDFLLKK